MRILLRLEPLDDMPYDNDYHYHMQAFLYSLIRDAGREDLHDSLGYKFFCFSNIFPYQMSFIKGREVNLLISSPDPAIVSGITGLVMSGKVEEVKIGAMRFKISGLEGPFRINVDGQPVKLRSATPIIIRIPTSRYAEYEIQSERPYVFWRETIPLEAFVKQLRDNMEKKIVQYRSQEKALGYVAKEHEAVPLPDVLSYRFVKIVSKPITVKGEKQQVIGSLWELEFAPQSALEALNLEFAAESGFGERNALGFGFMNPI
ncbi:MAG: CRISPR-associated endoribonuclease Cas6 [Nitrososphaerales archaeon]